MAQSTSFPKHHDQQNSSNDPIISIKSGQVRGEACKNYDRFLGIPYAEPPVEALRFQLPAPIKPWEGIYDTTQYGSPAPQLPIKTLPAIFTSATRLREDDQWLTVNVWAPKNAHNAPVFVWIHGGACTLGSNAETIYDGDTFARDGIVYVNINYRLGLEGFGLFSDAPPNRGIADQILALHWVQDNISAFGGDPQNVTIGGESAGSMSVAVLLTSPQTQELFQQAIMQSGAPILNSPAENTEYVQEVAAILGISPTAYAFAQMSPQQILPAMDIVSQQPKHYQRLLLCSPVIDGTIIQQDPLKKLSTSPINIPLLIGYNACEVAFAGRVLQIFPEITWDNFSMTAAGLGLSENIIAAYQNHYYGQTTADEAFFHLLSDRAFVSPIRSIIQQNNQHAYAYIFAWQDLQDNKLSYHLLELPFVFDHLNTVDGQTLAGMHAPQILAQEMHTAWVNFIKTGNPGWVNAGEPAQYHIFDDYLPCDNSSQKNIIDPRAELVKLWRHK